MATILRRALAYLTGSDRRLNVGLVSRGSVRIGFETLPASSEIAALFLKTTTHLSSIPPPRDDRPSPSGC